jgi:hypothetical protein
MVAKEVFVNYHNLILFGYNMHHSVLKIKKKSTGTHSSQKGNCQGTVCNKFIRSRGWSRSRHSDLRLRGAGAEYVPALRPCLLGYK